MAPGSICLGILEQDHHKKVNFLKRRLRPAGAEPQTRLNVDELTIFEGRQLTWPRYLPGV